MLFGEKLSEEYFDWVISEKEKFDDGIDCYFVIKIFDFLVGFSFEEVNFIDKKVILKLDLFLMLVLMVFYIL